MEQAIQKRIWIYADNGTTAENVLSRSVLKGSIVGISYLAGEKAILPHGGLVPALQAAMRGEIDLLLLEAPERMGNSAERAGELLQTFESYGVSVKSFNSIGSSNS